MNRHEFGIILSHFDYCLLMLTHFDTFAYPNFQERVPSERRSKMPAACCTHLKKAWGGVGTRDNTIQYNTISPPTPPHAGGGHGVGWGYWGPMGYCIVLYCIVLHCIVLYCIVLVAIVFG